MDLSKLSRAELVGVIASAILVLALIFLPWYDLGANPTREMGQGFICGTNQFECTGWETFPILRWILIAVAIAPVILGYIFVRQHKLSWAPGEVTMVLGFVAFVMIAYNGIIDPPGDKLQEIGITNQIGYWVALAASAGIATAGVLRVLASQKGARKTPGTV